MAPKGKNPGAPPPTSNKAPPKPPAAAPAPKPTPAPATNPPDTVSSSSTSPAIQGDFTPIPSPTPKNPANTTMIDQQPDPYPNIHYDPDPLPPSASDARRSEYATQANELGQKTLTAYEALGLHGEELWVEFISVFRPHTIKLWDHILLTSWVSLFRNNGVHVDYGRAADKAQRVIDLLYRDNHVGCLPPKPTPPHTHPNPAAPQSTLTATVDPAIATPNPAPVVSEAVQSPPDPHQGVPLAEDPPTVQPRKGPYVHPDRAKFVYNVSPPPPPPAESTFHSPPPPSELPASARDVHNPPVFVPDTTVTFSTNPGGSPPDDDDDDDGNYDRGKGRPVFGHSKGLRPSQLSSDRSNGDSPGGNRGLGVSGLMKAFIGKPTFSGNWEEDLDNVVSIFNTLATMCQVDADDKLTAIPIMLQGDALSYFSSNAAACTTFDEAVELLQKWYNGDDKKARILSKWQDMRLSKAMSGDPDASEVAIFRKFVADLMSLQKQLDKTYHADQFLRDRLLTAVDIPSIQSSLRDRLPRTSQHAINRVAVQLSDRAKTAGMAAACVAEDADEANYSLGKIYGGDAKRTVKKPYKGRGGRSRQGGRRLNSSWMRGVKGCFVCGQDHRANTRHSRDEVTAAINKLKAKHPSALLSVEDLSTIVNMASAEAEEQSDEDGVMWGEDSESDSEGSDLVLMAAADLKQVEISLANNAFIHGMPSSDTTSEAYITMHSPNTRGRIPTFNGVTVDTAANRRSVMSESQYLAYQREFGRRVPMRPPRRDVKGIGGKTAAIGEVTIQIPFNQLGVVIDVDFTILKGDTPSLLSNKDMLESGLDISLQGGFLYIGDRQQPLYLENYFFIHRWSSNSTPFVLFTEKELRRIHRSFGHPSVNATHNLLKRASTKPLSKHIRRKLERLADNCRICRDHASAPRRFKLTVGSEGLAFNNRIIVDTMFLDGRPVIHIIDEATHFSAAGFLRSQSAKSVWKAVLSLWTLMYLGPPDFLGIDQGSNYVSAEFRSNAEAQGISIEEAPIETPGAIGIVERYHAPLRAAYQKVRASIDKRDASDEECLRMATYAINSTMGPEGLVPMLLVFGALPRPARTTPAPDQLRRQQVVEEAGKAAEKEQAKRRLAFALRHPSGPKGKEASAALRKLTPGAKVLVYRTKSGRWEGPFTFISVDGETAVIQLERGRKIFRSVCIRPYNATLDGSASMVQAAYETGQAKRARCDEDDDFEPSRISRRNAYDDDFNPNCAKEKDRNDAANHATTDDDLNRYDGALAVGDDYILDSMGHGNSGYGDEMTRQEDDNLYNNNGQCGDLMTEDQGGEVMTAEGCGEVMTVEDDEDLGSRPRKVKVKAGSAEEKMFEQPRRAELEGLMANGTFKVIDQSDVPEGARVFGSRFVDEIKRAGMGLRKKSRLVSQSYADEEAALTATKAPTVQRLSQRAALSVAASVPELESFLRDIIQAYIQSLSKLQRRIFIRAPKELGLPPGTVLEVVKPLYGIPESGLHWYITYLSHHLDKLGMKRSKVDPCVLVRRDGTNIKGMVLLQVDDSLGFGTGDFLAQEEAASVSFKSKPRSLLTEQPTPFNGVLLRAMSSGYNDTAATTHEESDKMSGANGQREHDSGTPHNENATPEQPMYEDEHEITQDSGLREQTGQGRTNTKAQRTVRFMDEDEANDYGKQPGKKNNESNRKETQYRMSQEDKIEALKYAQTEKDFVSQRALGQYIGVNVRPDVCAPIQLLAPGKEPPTKGEYKTLQKVTKFLKETATQGLDFVKLDLDSVRLTLLTDASFANARNFKSQLGYLVLMVDKNDDCNIVHFGSNRCKRVARSVMAAELFALVLGFDYAFVVQDLLRDMTGRTFPLEALVDSKTVFDIIAKQSQTSEKRLQIDAMALRQSYDVGEMNRMGWLPGDDNAADPLTKLRLSLLSPLYRIMVTNRFTKRPKGWAAAAHEQRNPPSVN